MINRRWAAGFLNKAPVYDLGLFIGELEDVPERRFGFLLPNRRTFAASPAPSVTLPVGPANAAQPPWL
jgi:hypothetical protein